jgi:5-methylcytosine-specific restriction protein B
MSKINFAEIDRENIIEAFNKYDELKLNNEVNHNRKAKEYILFWNSKEYPHKYIVGIAYGIKNNQAPLDNTLYNSTGNHKGSAEWCLKQNGFVLYADKRYREYLQNKYDNQTTINTYYSDLKKAIKIFQNIDKLKDKNLNEIFEIMRNGNVSFEEYDKSQKELGFNDKQLFSTLKTKAKTYLEAVNGDNMNTIKIKVGEFLQEHAQNIINMCSTNLKELSNLQDIEYTKSTFGLRSNYPLFNNLINISNSGHNNRYYKKNYMIDDDTYRLCSQFGGSQIIESESASEYHGKKIYNYLNTHGLLLDKFKDKEIIFIVGSDTTVTTEEAETTPVIENIKQPLNHILYGPPGTSKTYSTINKALEIIFEKEDKEDIVYYDFDFEFEQKEISYNDALKIEDGSIKRKVLKNIFEHYVKARQIEFVTFHQSYGYEEFIEGIKAIPVGEEGNETGKEMIYKVVNGVFKSLVKECTSKDEIQENNLTNYDSATIWKMSLGDSQNGEDKEYFEEAVNTDTIIMGYGGDIDYSNCHDKKSIEQLNKKDTSASMIHRFKNELKNDDILIISDGNRKFKAIVQVVEDYFYDENSDFKHKRKIKWLKKFTTSRNYSEISDRYFTQVTLNRPQGVNKEALLDYLSETTTIDNSNKNYILIIDEINRGNISKIFGELITLIEDSKRAGSNEAIEIILPYSGEPFTVPKNLYILGTMNTADRSIALMDTALRRRFEFTEMMPNLKVLKQIDDFKNINIKSLLKTINKRIEYLYDRDHTIGHAYFMSLNDQIKDENDLLRDKTDEEKLIELKGIFQNKIIPLLQEYFYDDWEKIRLVLGDNQKDDKSIQFINIKQGYDVKNLFGDKGLDSLDIDDESNVYEINKKAFNNPKSYIKVYEK